ncbi:ComF family protein [Hydrocarboniphaga sp.]|uniref:ComF family protein n=1 Tax=Hydrocarboniphaga sp. TaxID=2033016 RepID=UPI003D12D3AB
MIDWSRVYNFRPWLDLAAAPSCLYCGAGTAGSGCCEGCRYGLPWNRLACPGCALPSSTGLSCPRCLRRPRRFDQAWSAFVLAAPVHSGLLGLKYHARFEQARVLGELMACELRSRARPLPELLLPVPLHWRRLAGRGYNQALLLARELGARLDLPVDTRSLRRHGAGRDQIGQSASARRANLRGLFSASPSLQGRHVALVDDVMTTGATFDELARVCRKAGAATIEVWSAARTP